MTRLSLFSLISFLLSFGVLTGAYQVYHSKHHSFVKSESQAIQAQIEERFKLYVRSTFALQKVALEFWKQPVITTQEFHALGEAVLSIYPEFTAANFVQPDGKISLVHPHETNTTALGKVTQNLKYLKNSNNFKNGFWMSQPFELFQGGTGFIYYFQLTKDKELVGWYGIVVSQQLFLDHFINKDQFENFHIQITDVETGKDYISTASLPQNFPGEDLRSSSFEILNRQIYLRTWPKDPSILPNPWLIIIFLSFVFTLLATLAWNFFQQKKQSKKQINELNLLLKHIIHDTANSVAAIKGYVELMKEDPKLVPVERLTRNVGFVVEFIEQIKLIRGLAEPDTSWEQSKQPLLPLVIESVELISDSLNEKSLTLNYDPETLAILQTQLNQNLFVHAVLTKVLTTLIKFAKFNTIISLSSVIKNDIIYLKVSISRSDYKTEKSDELSLRIANQVMELQGGSFKIDGPIDLEMGIQLGLPT